MSQIIRKLLEQKYAEDGCGLPINFLKSNFYNSIYPHK